MHSNTAVFIVLFQSRSVLQQYAASVATRGIMHSNTAIFIVLFQSRSVLQQYAASVATRGIMHSNTAVFIVLFQSRSVLQQYAASVATRGIMHSNTARARHNATGGSLGWKPLHKPQCYSISKLVSTTASHMD